MMNKKKIFAWTLALLATNAFGSANKTITLFNKSSVPVYALVVASGTALASAPTAPIGAMLPPNSMGAQISYPASVATNKMYVLTPKAIANFNQARSTWAPAPGSIMEQASKAMPYNAALAQQLDRGYPSIVLTWLISSGQDSGNPAQGIYVVDTKDWTISGDANTLTFK